MSTKIVAPSTVLDPVTIAAAGEHDEPLYCLDSVDTTKLPASLSNQANYLFIPTEYLVKAKEPVQQMGLKMAEYPFFKVSRFSPSIMRIHETATTFESRAMAVVVAMTTKGVQSHKQANYWMLEKINGSYFPVFCGRHVLESTK